MQKKEEYLIVPAEADQVKFFEDIQKSLQWDPLINTYLILSEISSQGLLLGKINGKIVSCILALKFSKQFGFIGVYWVKKQFRGKGYGVQIFIKALQYLKDCETIGLDSVPQQLTNYQKWGFASYCNATKCYAANFGQSTNHRSTKIFKNYKHVNFDKILAFDAKVFPVGQNRKKQLIKTFENGQVFISEKDGLVVGYGVVFRCCSGLALAPMYAINDDVAEDIVNEIFQHYKKSGHYFMSFVFDEYKRISTFMRKKFNRQGYNCQRMYLRMPHFQKDFDRSCVYSFNSYQRG